MTEQPVSQSQDQKTLEKVQDNPETPTPDKPPVGTSASTSTKPSVSGGGDIHLTLSQYSVSITAGSYSGNITVSSRDGKPLYWYISTTNPSVYAIYSPKDTSFSKATSSKTFSVNAQPNAPEGNYTLIIKGGFSPSDQGASVQLPVKVTGKPSFTINMQDNLAVDDDGGPAYVGFTVGRKNGHSDMLLPSAYVIDGPEDNGTFYVSATMSTNDSGKVQISATDETPPGIYVIRLSISSQSYSSHEDIAIEIFE